MGNNSSCCQPRENPTQIKIAQKITENEDKNERTNHSQENSKYIIEYYDKS